MNNKGEMDGTTEFDAPFKYFSHQWRKDIGKEQYARDQSDSHQKSILVIKMTEGHW